MTTKELTCIGCPMGCQLTVYIENDVVTKVYGNTCKNGEIYAKKECTNPTRIVTSTVKVLNGEINSVSVKTKTDIPKDKIFECIKALQNLKLEAPVKVGQVIIKNVANTNVDVIATKNIKKLNI